jgi:hypothetical protein
VWRLHELIREAVLVHRGLRRVVVPSRPRQAEGSMQRNGVRVVQVAQRLDLAQEIGAGTFDGLVRLVAYLWDGMGWDGMGWGGMGWGWGWDGAGWYGMVWYCTIGMV